MGEIIPPLLKNLLTSYFSYAIITLSKRKERMIKMKVNIYCYTHKDVKDVELENAETEEIILEY